MRVHDITNLDDLRLLSKEVFSYNAKVFLLSGDLGAGKTTFVATFIRENLLTEGENFEDLGVMSPTFSIINHYSTRTKKIIHADMYRLGKTDFEQEDLLQDIEDSDYTFIEWPCKISQIKLITDNFEYLFLDFKLDPDSNRKVFLKQL